MNQGRSGKGISELESNLINHNRVGIIKPTEITEINLVIILKN
jgi:hypothetical protein